MTHLRTATLALLVAGALSTAAFFLYYEIPYVDPGEFAATVLKAVAAGALPYALLGGGTLWLRSSRARLTGLVGAAVILFLGTSFYAQIFFGPPDSKAGVGLVVVLAAQIALALITVGVAWLLNVLTLDDA